LYFSVSRWYIHELQPYNAFNCFVSIALTVGVNAMADCRSASCGTKAHRKHRCPENGIEYSGVSTRTILHHIRKPWAWRENKQGYYFCEDPKCDVVYFGDDDSVITKSEVRLAIGVKEASEDAPLCYCFGISKADFSLNPSLRDFVIQKTKNGLCSCETSNPSGQCCLKDFPSHEKPDTKSD
jgi:hypothetical protein